MDAIVNLLSDLYAPVLNALNSLSVYLIDIALAMIFLAVSVIILRVLKGVVEKVLDIIRLDNVADALGINALLGKGLPKATLSGVVVAVLYWISLLGILAETLKLLGVGRMMVKSVELLASFIPGILFALFIMIVASLVAKVVEFIIKVIAAYVPIVNEGLLSKAAVFVVYLYAILRAIGELGIVDASVITTLLVIAAVGFALSAALGLQKEAAAVLKGLTKKK